jgi:cysteine desulfurase
VGSGTLNVPAVVGLAVAVGHAVADLPRRFLELTRLRDELVGRVLAVVPDAVLNGDRVDQLIGGGPSRLPGNAHLSFPGCEGDSLIMLMDAQGIECSTGSACTAGVARPSHVLLAMGADEAVARGSLRFSLGHTSTPADVAAVARVIGPVVERYGRGVHQRMWGSEWLGNAMRRTTARTAEGEWKRGGAGTWGCRPCEGQAGIGGDDCRAGSGAG